MPTLLARAKINWTLDISGTRADGYHWMDMLMESVALADELRFETAETISLTVEGNPDVPQEDNLVLKAAHALQQATGCMAGAALHLRKHIPVGGGMGGGSADAAAALVGLNWQWQTGLSVESLRKIALSVGADVPFMVSGGLARVRGIGEEISPCPSQAAVPLVIVQPCKALPTRESFAAFDRLVQVAHPDTAAAETALKARDLTLLARVGGNVLSQASEQLRPQIADAVAALYACEAAYAFMTGSGSAVVGAYQTEEAADGAFRMLRKRWRHCWRTRTASKGLVWR